MGTIGSDYFSVDMGRNILLLVFIFCDVWVLTFGADISRLTNNGQESSHLLVRRVRAVETDLTAPEIREIIHQHNHYRSLEGSSNMEYLTWNLELARMARDHVQLCTWFHGEPSRAGYNISYPMIGENLQYTTGGRNFSTAIWTWYREKEYYDYTNRNCTEGEMCGHYTQVVWALTREVGCGVTICPNLTMDDGGPPTQNARYFACNYGKRGNYEGASPYRKGANCSECTAGNHTCRMGLCYRGCPDANQFCDSQMISSTTTTSRLTDPATPTTSTSDKNSVPVTSADHTTVASYRSSMPVTLPLSEHTTITPDRNSVPVTLADHTTVASYQSSPVTSPDHTTVESNRSSRPVTFPEHTLTTSDANSITTTLPEQTASYRTSIPATLHVQDTTMTPDRSSVPVTSLDVTETTSKSNSVANTTPINTNTTISTKQTTPTDTSPSPVSVTIPVAVCSLGKCLHGALLVKKASTCWCNCTANYTGETCQFSKAEAKFGEYLNLAGNKSMWPIAWASLRPVLADSISRYCADNFKVCCGELAIQGSGEFVSVSNVGVASGYPLSDPVDDQVFVVQIVVTRDTQGTFCQYDKAPTFTDPFISREIVNKGILYDQAKVTETLTTCCNILLMTSGRDPNPLPVTSLGREMAVWKKAVIGGGASLTLIALVSLVILVRYRRKLPASKRTSYAVGHFLDDDASFTKGSSPTDIKDHIRLQAKSSSNKTRNGNGQYDDNEDNAEDNEF